MAVFCFFVSAMAGGISGGVHMVMKVLQYIDDDDRALDVPELRSKVNSHRDLSCTFCFRTELLHSGTIESNWN